jgi:hypothetical protein
VREETVRLVDGVLADCEARRYAAAAATDDALHQRAYRCIQELEREKL